ncbi:hypothetical protein JI435_422160 [Parastagonospora nodorum SN15]|uniref:Uncharacterized protein n=1 Tax=Phaeosphaeria nodorum (strain SN15 / ATCC MYA-4574 / FGSC 10173) TaxID=321614 RepID=A0A7U2FKX4_PHANO|nr:hypothetical protein JI435_422160 [Parastagonospora nodorum SN15]
MNFATTLHTVLSISSINLLVSGCMSLLFNLLKSLSRDRPWSNGTSV